METTVKEDKENPKIVHCFAVETSNKIYNILGITNFSNIVLVAKSFPSYKTEVRLELANNLIKEHGVKSLTEIKKVFV